MQSLDADIHEAVALGFQQLAAAGYQTGDVISVELCMEAQGAPPSCSKNIKVHTTCSMLLASIAVSAVRIDSIRQGLISKCAG